ncbi:PREDICTED: protein SRC2-like [Ipomoea nil]|uniref:protein SRC2-like n=1 Tax=Ipomoea nil TaxID=35883 RepID=UPI000901F0F1|nr:PREDICTED: protein SRC2-like [Ipomoea nil]
MCSLPLDITVVSADAIKDVNTFTKMDVFVVVSVIIGYQNTRNITPVHKNAGTSPRWNHHMRFVVDEATVNNPGAGFLHFQLVSERTFGNKDIGVVRVPVDDLFAKWSKDSDGAGRVMEFEVITARTEKKKGTLKFSYKFGEKFTQGENYGVGQFAAAYPPPEAARAGSSVPYAPPPGMGYDAPPGAAGGYPAAGYGGYSQMGPGVACPPQPGYGYPPPPTHGYGYPPPPGAGYGGYQPVQQQEAPKKSKFGLGGAAGLGLGAGLLGGLVVGDMMSNAGEMAAYDEGYSEGVGDMGGYDF